MKILKEGNKLKEKINYYRLTCSRCGCEFEFTTADASKLLRELTNQIGEVICPQCGMTHTFFTLDWFRSEYKDEKK